MLLPVTHVSPWRTSVWWLYGPGSEQVFGVAIGFWDLPGKSWGCAMAGKEERLGGCHSKGTLQERIQIASTVGPAPASGIRHQGWR